MTPATTSPTGAIEIWTGAESTGAGSTVAQIPKARQISPRRATAPTATASLRSGWRCVLSDTTQGYGSPAHPTGTRQMSASASIRAMRACSGRLAVAAWAWASIPALALGGCSSVASRDVTLTNKTDRTIRVTGACVEDDPHTVDPGQTDNALFLGADCVIDNGDGLNGILGCVTLRHRHTNVALGDLRPISGPSDCSRSGNH